MSDYSVTSGPGDALRAVRRNNNWTLADIAARAGIPLSTLSKIENGQISPTYDQLMRLSESLRIDISELFARRPREAVNNAGGRRSVNRLGGGERIETDSRVQHYLSTDLLNKQFTPIVSEAKAHTLEEFGEFMRHPGEEFVYVVEGVLALHTDCYAPVILQAGESIYFDSSMGHAYLAQGEGTCRFLSICTVEGHAASGSASAETSAADVVTTVATPSVASPAAAKPEARAQRRRATAGGRR